MLLLQSLSITGDEEQKFSWLLCSLVLLLSTSDLEVFALLGTSSKPTLLQLGVPSQARASMKQLHRLQECFNMETSLLHNFENL